MTELGLSRRLTISAGLRGQNEWSEAELIDHMHRAYRHGGGRLTARSYEEYREDNPAAPSRTTVTLRLGDNCWATALQRAGYPVGRGGRQMGSGKFTPAVMRAAIITVAEQVGRAPTVQEYDAYKREHPEVPSNALIRRTLGSWPDALRSAGLI
jgi:hypothetical protein